MQDVVRKYRYLLLLVSGVLSSLAVVYPQYFGALAWISLIPAGLVLMLLGDKARLGGLYLYGFVFYLVYYVMSYHWFISMFPMDFAGLTPGAAAGVIALAVLGISAFQAMLGALMFLVYGLLCRTVVIKRIPLLRPLLFGCLWVVNEWSQTIGWTGLPWARLYLSQSFVLPMAQSASLLGGLLVSLLIVAANLALAGMISCRGHRLSYGLLGGCVLLGNLLFGLAAMDSIKGNALAWQIGFVLVAVVTVSTSLVYGLVRSLGSDVRVQKSFIALSLMLCVLCAASSVLDTYADPAQTVRAAALQGNLSSKDKWADDAGLRSFNVYAELTEMAAEDGAELVVWPETALAYTLFNAHPNSAIRAPLRSVYDLAERTDTTMMISTFTSTQYFDPEAEKASCNSVIAFYPNRTYDENIYVKRQLVPFGEYVPWREFLLNIAPVLGQINMLENDLAGGEEAIVVDAWTLDMRLGPIICFDSIYEDTVRQTVAEGAEIITLSTNDSWFSDSAAVYMHNNHAKFRAIENGRYLVRSANTGVSSIIAPDGEVLGEQDALTTGYVVADVCARENQTPYSAVGYLLVWVCFGMQGVLVLVHVVYVIVSRYKCHKKP